MRRITLAVMSTLAALVLLFSYRTSTGDGGTTTAAVVSPARIVAEAPMTTAASGGPDPGSTSNGTSRAAGRSSVVPGSPPPRTPLTTTPRATSPRTTATTPTTRSSASATPVAPISPTPPAAAPVTVQGSTEMTRYGAVQVQLTIVGRTITDVTALAYPDGGGRDQEINAFAVPELQNQVLQAQSAHVQGVSGATYTTEGFLASVQSALDAVGFQP